MYSALITALSDMFAQFFKLKTVQVEKQESTEIIHDKKDYKKATNIAEQLISLTQKYYDKMTACDRFNYSRLLNKFNKVN